MLSIGTITILDEIVSLLSIKVSYVRISKKSNLEQGTSSQRTIEVVPSLANTTKIHVKPKILLKDNVYPKSYYHHNQATIEGDETP